MFVAPFLIVFTTLLVYPLLSGIWLSLHKADLFGGSQFVGFGNYVRLFHDKVFLQSVWNTFYFVLLTVPTLALIGLVWRWPLNRSRRSAAVLRTLFFSSSVLSVTIVTLIWRMVLVPDGGLIADLLAKVGLAPIPFLSDAHLVMPAIAITTIWWCIGLPMMLFLAALQQVPKELYEAATLDNAGWLRTLASITLPSIRRTVIAGDHHPDRAAIPAVRPGADLTLGGPNNASLPIVFFIYQVGFQRWDLGLGAAASEILFILILIAAMAQYLVRPQQGG